MCKLGVLRVVLFACVSAWCLGFPREGTTPVVIRTPDPFPPEYPITSPGQAESAACSTGKASGWARDNRVNRATLISDYVAADRTIWAVDGERRQIGQVDLRDRLSIGVNLNADKACHWANPKASCHPERRPLRSARLSLALDGMMGKGMARYQSHLHPLNPTSQHAPTVAIDIMVGSSDCMQQLSGFGVPWQGVFKRAHIRSGEGAA